MSDEPRAETQPVVEVNGLQTGSGAADGQTVIPLVAERQMQPQASPVPGLHTGGETDSTPILALLRRLRAEVQDLRGVIDLVEAGKLALQSQTAYLKQSKADIAQIATGLQEYAAVDDTVAHIVNIVQQMEHSPLLAERTEPLPAQEQTNAVSILKEQIQKVELLAGSITIPSRLNDWLDKARPGYYVPFHLVFRDEIPNEEDRRTLLNHLAWAPEVVKNGIVDVTNGVVFRSAKESSERWASIGWLLLAVLISLAIVVGAAYLPLPAWAPAAGTLTTDVLKAAARAAANQRAAAFAVGWLAVLLGVLAHLGVAGVKREQTTGLPTVLAVAGLTEVINARLGQFLWKLALVLIGFFALVFAIDATASPINAFLVGYSLDSIVGIFGANVENRVKALQTQLAPK